MFFVKLRDREIVHHLCFHTSCSQQIQVAGGWRILPLQLRLDQLRWCWWHHIFETSFWHGRTRRRSRWPFCSRDCFRSNHWWPGLGCKRANKKALAWLDSSPADLNVLMTIDAQVAAGELRSYRVLELKFHRRLNKCQAAGFLGLDSTKYWWTQWLLLGHHAA